MPIIVSFISYLLLLPAVYFADLSANSPGSEIVFVGSTPGDSSIKAMLSIPAETKVDFIRWNLVMNEGGPEEKNKFRLDIQFAEAEPNTLGFKGGGERQSFEGEFIDAETIQGNLKGGMIFHLKSDKLPDGIALYKVNENILQLLTPQNRLMVGNGGWSYTLNRDKPLPARTLLPSTANPGSLRKDKAVQFIFEGRTPCQDFARAYDLKVSPDCFKLKWKLTLNRDPVSLLPTTYKLQTTFNREADIAGDWTIIQGLPSNPDCIIYQLNRSQAQKSFKLVLGDENLLFFLTEDNELFVGNGDFSFTLNKRKAQ